MLLQPDNYGSSAPVGIHCEVRLAMNTDKPTVSAIIRLKEN